MTMTVHVMGNMGSGALALLDANPPMIINTMVRTDMGILRICAVAMSLKPMLAMMVGW